MLVQKNGLFHSRVADSVYLIEHGEIIKTQVIRVTPHQIQIENGDKFWKSTGGRVGDSSKSKAVIYAIDNNEVKELYRAQIMHYKFYEWLNQLKVASSIKKIDLDVMKPLLESIYDTIMNFESIELEE